jgi:uncharacterized protein (TIGR02118 family)
MIKVVVIIRRRQNLSVEDFHRYWLHNHAPLVRKFSRSLRMRKYVQSHTVAPEMGARLAQARQMGEGFDGTAEVWWNSLEDMFAVLRTAEGLEASLRLGEDEAQFIDFARSHIFITEEHTILDYSPDAPDTART